MLIITGLGRCGMSLIGQVLLTMNYRGGMLPQIHDLNMSLNKQDSIDLDSPCDVDYWKDHTFKQAIDRCNKDKREGPVHFAIDPLFIWNPDLIRAWWNAGKKLKVLVVTRKFEDYVDSYKRNPPEEGSCVIDDPDLYNIYVEGCKAVLKELEIPHHISIFPKFLKDSRTMFRAVKIMSHLQYCHNVANRIMQEILEG